MARKMTIDVTFPDHLDTPSEREVEQAMRHAFLMHSARSDRPMSQHPNLDDIMHVSAKVR